MFSVIFDVEAVVLYAWTVSVRQDGWTGFAIAAIFIVTAFHFRKRSLRILHIIGHSIVA